MATAKEPMLGEIRLAWWRERLVALAQRKSPPAEPLLMALAADAASRGTDLKALSALEDGVLPLLLEGPLDAAVMGAARGGPLFVALAEALAPAALGDTERAAAQEAGARFGAAQLWRGAWGQAAGRLEGLPSPLPLKPVSGPLPGHLRGLLALADDDLARISAQRPLAIAASMGRQWRLARAAF